MLIDDDRHEAVFWRHIIETSFRGAITLEHRDNVDEALEDLDDFCPDTIILDNKVPPYDCASHCLTELANRSYRGAVYVWSFAEKQALRERLSKWPEIEILSKQDYMGFKVRDLIEQRLM